MKQTRGALKFLLAEYRAVLKNAMLAMILTATAGIGCAYADNDQTVYMGAVTINGESKTPDKSGTVNIGKNGDTVVIANTKTDGDKNYEKSGIAINKPSAETSVTVLGKDISISGYRGVYATCDNNIDKKKTITIGNGSTENLVITQNYEADTQVGNENAQAVFALKKGTTINLKAKNIDISSVARYTVHAQNNTEDKDSAGKEGNATINIVGDSISITNNNSYIDGAGISAYSNSIINVTGDLYVKAARAIETRGYATININTDGTHKTVLDGDIVFGTDKNGSGKTVNANLNLNLTGSDSVWTGNLSTYYPTGYSDDDKAVSGINITLANGAQWNVKKFNERTNTANNVKSTPLTLNNLNFDKGVINLTEELLSDNETVSQNNIVKIDKLTGTGGTVNVAATATENGTRLETAKLVTQNADISDSLAVNLTGINADDISNVDSAMKDAANAVTVSNTDSSLKQTITVEEGDINGQITATTDGKGTPTGVTQKENSKLAALGSVTAMNFMQWRHDMNDLNKRMGELRDSATGVGVWARAYGSEHKYGSQNVTAKNKSIQIGSDTDVGAGWKVGGAFTYTDGDATYTNGKADNKAYGFALYGSWFADNGLFVDLIGKYSHLSSDYELGNMKGGLHNTALSLSAEVGWNIPFADIAFIEPQAELSYGIIYGDTDHTSNGVYLKQDDMKTLIGRTGFRTGLHFNENKGTVYARASVLHDFQGETKFYASNNVTSTVKSDDLGGTYYEFGLGANYKFTPNCYSYVDLERQTHGPIAEKWRWNVGMRYVF